MSILENVPDYNIVYNTTTGLFEKSSEVVVNPLLASVVYNSYGIGIVTDSELNASLSLSADDILAPEIPFPVTNPTPDDKERYDYVGGEGLNQTVSALNEYSEYVSETQADIETTIKEGVIESMKLQLVISIISPVIKTEYKPRAVVRPESLVTR